MHTALRPDYKLMSPVPNRPQPSKAASVQDSSPDESVLSDSKSDELAKSNLMRPVARPVAPVAPPSPPQVIVAIKGPKAAAPVVAPVVVPEPEPEPEEVSPVQRPIPAPSEPMQYRAIGLVRGTYIPEEEQFTKGTLVTDNGTQIEAVLLGRVMSLVRNHLSLEKEHLWVVYPRTREKEQTLHLQIVGVWEPENLNQSSDDDGDGEEVVYQPSTEVDDNYFSIRGEVVFHSAEEQKSVVKIQQVVKKKKEEAQVKAFKLNVLGELPSNKTVGYFWDMHVKREGQELIITSCTPVKMVPPKRSTGEKRRFSPGGPRGGRPPMGGARRPPMGVSSAPAPKPRPQGSAPAPKPVIRKKDPTAAPTEVTETSES
jgi:hypothetical protein